MECLAMVTYTLVRSRAWLEMQFVPEPVMFRD